MHDEPYRCIPLHAWDKSVRGVAVVDAADYEWAAAKSWNMNTGGYAARRAGEHTSLMHRELLGLQHGDPRFGDHINGNRLDNRRSNLRIVTAAENAKNARPQRPVAKGAYQQKSGRWLAAVRIDGKLHTLGVHDTEEEAARVAADFRLSRNPLARC